MPWVYISWLPPKDNGGNEISNYIVEKKDPKTGEWVQVGTPVQPTLRVRNLQEGKPVEFRVRAENAYGISDPLVTLEPIVPKSPYGKDSESDFEVTIYS